jgi:hypothetical protein
VLASTRCLLGSNRESRAIRSIHRGRGRPSWVEDTYRSDGLPRIVLGVGDPFVDRRTESKPRTNANLFGGEPSMLSEVIIANGPFELEDLVPSANPQQRRRKAHASTSWAFSCDVIIDCPFSGTVYLKLQGSRQESTGPFKRGVQSPDLNPVGAPRGGAYRPR